MSFNKTTMQVMRKTVNTKKQVSATIWSKVLWANGHDSGFRLFLYSILPHLCMLQYCLGINMESIYRRRYNLTITQNK